MKRTRYLFQWIGILIVVAFIYTLAIEAKVVIVQSDEDAEKRADLITIDTLKSFGALERQAVPFLHDTHTDALEKINKDCEACHLTEKGDKGMLSLKFKRFEDTNRQEVMDIYHTNCFACHLDMAASGEKSGPIEVCGECHKDEPAVISSRQPMGFDKFLHFTHTEANKSKETNEGDCALCHHEYDKETDKLFYAKGKEGSCRYCHMAEDEENRIAMSLASHLSCIDCHREKSEINEKAGPTKCNGCHDINEQMKIEKPEYVPRIERNQPDVVLIGTMAQAEGGDKSPIKMNPVPFDHKAHEQYQDTCLICHHAEMDSCTKSCHTLVGSEKGKEVRVEQAMHQLGNEQSCLGCHEINQHQKECAGCHDFMEEGRKQEAEPCLKCHMEPIQADVEVTQKPELVAGKLLESRGTVLDTFDDEDIPEKVIIEELFYQYEAVEMPHRKIIHTLVNDIKNNKLANYFHNEKGTICQGCHHNSPVTTKPPSCASCHGEPFDENNPLRPGLKAAYHQQCMGCHRSMGIEKPKSNGCTDCHKVVGVNKLYDS